MDEGGASHTLTSLVFGRERRSEVPADHNKVVNAGRMLVRGVLQFSNHGAPGVSCACVSKLLSL